MAELPDVSGVDRGDPEARFGVIPQDKYPLQVTESQTFYENDGVTPRYLELMLEVISGPYQGRKLWDRLNLWHQSQQPREIAQRQLAQICHATNTIGARASEQFHYKAMIGYVVIRPPHADPKTGKQYSESNEIKGYASISGTRQNGGQPGVSGGQPALNSAAGMPTQVQSIPAATPQQTQPAQQKNTAPWRR